MLRNLVRRLITPIDGPLMGFAGALLLIAVIAVASASPERLTAQVVNIAVALAVMRVVAQIPPQRLMRLAEKFGRPILSLIDTPGAYPGIGAEERGQAEAIAFNLREMARLRVPVVVTVTGEGGSGGALAIGVGNRVNILEFAVYSVISPEGCAAILWRDGTRARDAARAMRMTAPDLLALDVADEIVPEVVGGAHVDPARQAALLGEVLERQLAELSRKSPEDLVASRYGRFRRMGRFTVPEPAG